MNPMHFKIKKLMDIGSGNKFCNRLNLQMFNLMKDGMCTLSKDEKDIIIGQLISMVQDLEQCDEKVKEISNIYDTFLEESKQGKTFKITHNSIQIDDPIAEVRKKIEFLLIRLIIALRRTFKIAEVIYKQDIDGPKKFTKILFGAHKKNDPILKMINDDKEWFKQLYDLRGMIEHSELRLSGFDIQFEGQNANIIAPRLLDIDEDILNYAEVVCHNTFTYCEELIVLMIETRLIDIIKLAEIPEEERENHKGFRFTLIPNIKFE